MYVGEFFHLMGGVLILLFFNFAREVFNTYCFSPLQWLVLVFLLQVGNFEVTYHIYFRNFVTVISTILLYHMYGGWFAGGWLGQGC